MKMARFTLTAPLVAVTFLLAAATLPIQGAGHPIPDVDVAGPADHFNMGSRLMTSGKRMTVRLTIPEQGTVRVPKFNGTFFYSPHNPEATTGTLLFRTDMFEKVKGKLAGLLTKELDFKTHPFFAFQSHSASKSNDDIDLKGKLIVKDRETEAVLRLVNPGSVAESRDGERWVKIQGEMSVDATALGLESLGSRLEFDLDLFLFNYTTASAKATGINSRALDREPPTLPKAADALSNSGWYLMLTQRYKEAIEAFDMSLDKDPNVVNVYLRRGDAYVFDGQYGKAVGTYRTVGDFFMPVHPHILELNKVLSGAYLTPDSLNAANQKWTTLQE